MKVTTKTTVTLELSLEEADILSGIAPNIGYREITNIGGGDDAAKKGAKLFSDITVALKEAKL